MRHLDTARSAGELVDERGGFPVQQRPAGEVAQAFAFLDSPPDPSDVSRAVLGVTGGKSLC